ncbi:MAG: hypothetical protein ABI591_10855 [Kofleriaceae bacterium]
MAEAPRAHKPHDVAVAGHAMAVVIGAASFVAGITALVKSLPGTMGVTLIIVGTLLPVLAHFSWRFSRAAWSLMVSTLCVFAAVTFFGAPKIAAVLGIGLTVSLVIPIVQVIAVIALAQLRRDYRE